MIEVWKKEYWSKSSAFLLPLTGLKKKTDFDIQSYLFWENYSIENYFLTVKVEYGHRYNEFVEFLNLYVFEKKKGFITESFDYEGFSILIFDLSEWGFDIEQFLIGKYSKMSEEAKIAIQNYHSFIKDGKRVIAITISSCLSPHEKVKALGNKTPLEYVITNYDVDAKVMTELGELCSLYDNSKETLVLVGQNDMKVSSE